MATAFIEQAIFNQPKMSYRPKTSAWLFCNVQILAWNKSVFTLTYARIVSPNLPLWNLLAPATQSLPPAGLEGGGFD